MKKFRFKQFSDFIDRFNLHGKKIVEIGCGNGNNLTIVKECGAEPYGIEFSEEAAEKAKSMGLHVYNTFLDSDNCKIDDIFFDGFYTFNFLEHLPNPLETLRGMRNNLSDNAYGIVEVPNTDMLLNGGVFYDFVLDHLFYFTKDTLKMLLFLSGYEVLSCNSIWNDFIISAIVQKRKKLDLSCFERQKEIIITQIDKYISGYESYKVAVWGASHQAFFILALLKNARQLKYVVDSAEFKQGRYTPVSQIPIVAPEQIHADPVKAIIVMASSFSDEVVKHIKNRFDRNIDISVLRSEGLEIVI
jgi:SAM-dependent methyltransferase